MSAYIGSFRLYPFLTEYNFAVFIVLNFYRPKNTCARLLLFSFDDY